MVGERPARSDSMSELQKQSHFIPGIAALFMEASGVPPPSGEDALRLSPGRHAGRKSEERPARRPPSLARERGDSWRSIGKRPNEAKYLRQMLEIGKSMVLD